MKRLICASLFLPLFSWANIEWGADISGRYHNLVPSVGGDPGNRFWFETKAFVWDNDPVIQKKLDFIGQYNDLGYFQFSVPEAFLSHHFGNVYFAYGRRNLRWSSIDSLWGLGKVNNRINLDFFNPGQEGLTGIHLEYKNRHGFFVNGFVSGLYIPETNPGLNIKNSAGTIRPKSMWSKPPATEANQDGNILPIRYFVDIPPEEDILLNNSIGVDLGFENDWVGVNGFYLNKPENNLTTRADVSFETGDNFIFANVRPEVFRHSVYGGRVIGKYNSLRGYLGILGTRPNRFPEQDPLVTQFLDIKTEKRKEEYFGAGSAFANDDFKIALHYLARISEYNITDDPLAQEPRWNQAFNLILERFFWRRVKITLDLKYDTLSFDRLTSLEGTYFYSDHLNVSLGLNIIGTPQNTSTFWSDYRTNDSLYAQLQYVY